MNGIEFIVRDRAGWSPPIPPPAALPEESPEPPSRITDEEAAFIRSRRGFLYPTELAAQYGVTPSLISAIQLEQRRQDPK
ncbi:hypothetical protein RAN3_1865 [plant metagenome]|uniref:Uncharacterized protein n=1 Tax=plant metagenome TaxID=1297885 RepID=A0A484VCY6_9ZZZZ